MNQSAVKSTRILFFAALREELGCSQLQLELEQPVAVQQLLQQLGAAEQDFARFLQQYDVLVAVNQQLVTMDAIVMPGAEIAIFPPVTGG